VSLFLRDPRPEPLPSFELADVGGAHDRRFAIDEPYPGRVDISGMVQFGYVNQRNDRSSVGFAHQLTANFGGCCSIFGMDADKDRICGLLG
jgi:hypothetical protein